MNHYNFGNNANKTIGIIGFGHLGHSLALPLVKEGFPKKHLLISHGSSEATYRKAREAGLAECLADAKNLAERADVVIVAVRPQDVLSLSGLAFKKNALVISCMAGLPLDLLRKIFEIDVHRMMCSGPDTILEGRGIATLFPADERVSEVLGLIGMRIFETKSEAELDSFTAGICLPAILLNIRVAKKEVNEAMDEMKKTYPVYGHLHEWIGEVAPQGEKVEKHAYLEGVSTKGGISEAMTGSLRSGSSLLAALLRGLERGREITAGIAGEVSETLEAMKLAG